MNAIKMITLFDHPIWLQVQKYARVCAERDNLEFVNMPHLLYLEASKVLVNCVSCGAEIHPIRPRASSKRSRIAGSPTELHPFYSPTCDQTKNKGCCRTAAARDHKKLSCLHFTKNGVIPPRKEWVPELLKEENPEALLADGFEEAIIGICRRYGQVPLATYDYEKCIEILMKRDGMSYEGAVEFFDYNVLGAWVGEGTPVYIQTNEAG